MLTVVACVALAFAGCGDDDSAETAAETTRATATTGEQGDTAGEQSNGTGGQGDADTKEAIGVGKTKPEVEVPKKLSPDEFAFRDVKKGTGATAKAGDEVTVHYVGVGFKTEEEFDSSWDRGEPLTFQLGVGQVIEGWDQGVTGMKVGGRREMLIPPDLGYGKAGTASIGPNETLIFSVDLLAVK